QVRIRAEEPRLADANGAAVDTQVARHGAVRARFEAVGAGGQRVEVEAEVVADGCVAGAIGAAGVRAAGAVGGGAQVDAIHVDVDAVHAGARGRARGTSADADAATSAASRVPTWRSVADQTLELYRHCLLQTGGV